MGKSIRVLLLLVLIALLCSCSEHVSKEKTSEKKGSDLEEQENQSQKSVEKNANEEAKQNLEQEVKVEVVDPNTKEVIKTIIPKEMGYGVTNDKYKADIEAWSKGLARGTETTKGYDQRMYPDRIGADGKIIKGKPRKILEEAELAQAIINKSEKGGTVELPIYTTQSGYKPTDVTHLDEVVVASYTTYFNKSVVGRTKNIELSATAINNVILGVQDIFSFNTTVGPSDQAHGYQKAKEAVNGKLVDGIGGGICQTSSTLYNAVDKLKVTYVEKHHHSVHVGYVPKGRDATVSYGGPDFRFQNTTGAPLLIKATVSDGKLTVQLTTSKAYKKDVKMG